MKKAIFFLALLCAAGLCMGNAAYAGLLPYDNTFIHVANDNGTKYNYDVTNLGAPAGTYYVKLTSSGKGLNAINLTTDLSNNVGGQVITQSTTTGSASGAFYITNTGGQGSFDDIILMVAVSGTISNNFQMNITSSGYTFTPGDTTTATYVTDAVNETFTKADFIYGPQTYRLSSLSDYPFYNGQDTSDPSTASYLMFVDLCVGTLSGANGPVSLTYSVSGLDTQVLAFDAYAWTGNSAQGEGINWTNNFGSSSYEISSAAPVPVPPALYLLGSGLFGLGFFRRRIFTA